MINLNRIELIGNLTKDPEVRFTPTNQAVASFAMATNRRYKDQANNWVDSPPEYTDVVVWAQLGERCGQILHKGDRIFVSGRLQTRSYEAQDGTKRYRTELIADTIIGPDVLNKNTGTGGGGQFEQSAPASTPARPQQSAPPPSSDEEINIDDIPF